MKKIIAMLLALAMVFSLCACNSEKKDAQFISSVQKGLEARWKTIDASPKQFSSTSQAAEYYAKYADVELKAIGELSEYTFEDAQLSTLANEYVAALKNQLEGAPYYGTDNNRYNSLYMNKGYYARAVILNKLVEEYGLTVSTHTDSFNSVLSSGKMYSALVSILSEDLTLESLGSPNYELLIENPSEYDFSNAALLLRCYDADGVVVDNTTTYLNNWAAGGKNRASFYLNNPFVSAELALQYITSNGTIVTDFVPIKYEDNMVIDIVLKNSLPSEYTYYSYSGNPYTSCVVDDFTYDIGYWNNGKASVNLKISGKKTFDADGDNYSRSCNVGWKLYDQSNNVIDSGTFYSSQISVGEVFRESSSYVSDLSVGTYTLELLDVR